jgi:type II secretory ATPase GspE/PulE/Tfp pilus assembly ATPase PilB-like protein
MSAALENPFAGLDFETQAADELADRLVQTSIAVGASDLMLMCEDGYFRLAVRHLGIVRRFTRMSMTAGRRLITAIKTRASLDISERRLPQDGRWTFTGTEDQPSTDIRVSVIPTLFGEDADLRFLARKSRLLSLNQLGLLTEQLHQLQAILSSPSGLVLVTGPSGSGKTTTLYGCLHQLNEEHRTINTIEDPIEYALPGIRQSQINPRQGLDFPDLLRAILRQSPDIIMIGEIRDPVTASTAVRAANSGHLVFATVHAPVAAAAVQSLFALGVEPYFLATALLGIVAQRLVRTLDAETRIAYDMAHAPQSFDELRPWLAPHEGTVMYGPGESTAASPDGYTGQTAVYEVLGASAGIRQMVADRHSVTDIQRKATGEGMIEFRRSAMIKVAQGVTSTEEVIRTVPFEYLGIDA